jgi:hypothetical protein
LLTDYEFALRLLKNGSDMMSVLPLPFYCNSVATGLKSYFGVVPMIIFKGNCLGWVCHCTGKPFSVYVYR